LVSFVLAKSGLKLRERLAPLLEARSRYSDSHRCTRRNFRCCFPLFSCQGTLSPGGTHLESVPRVAGFPAHPLSISRQSRPVKGEFRDSPPSFAHTAKRRLVCTVWGADRLCYTSSNAARYPPVTHDTSSDTSPGAISLWRWRWCALYRFQRKTLACSYRGYGRGHRTPLSVILAHLM
jgi:hypothetical protein